jgi:uncharacterized NAD(P)/FAD-binding protein YdhS
MLQNGDITRHPDGGITVDRQTYQVIRSDSSVDSRIFAVGEITSGQFFFTSALDIICRHAKLCAEAFHNIIRMSEVEEGIATPPLSPSDGTVYSAENSSTSLAR